jgi:hypothetical protein
VVSAPRRHLRSQAPDLLVHQAYSAPADRGDVRLRRVPIRMRAVAAHCSAASESSRASY